MLLFWGKKCLFFFPLVHPRYGHPEAYNKHMQIGDLS